MPILIFALVATLSLLNGNVFAGDSSTASFMFSARGEFETRLDHFRPQYFDKVKFVSHRSNDVFNQPEMISHLSTVILCEYGSLSTQWTVIRLHQRHTRL